MQHPMPLFCCLGSCYSLELVMPLHSPPRRLTFPGCRMLSTDGAVPVTSTFRSNQVVRAIVKDAHTDPHTQAASFEWLSAFP